MADATESRRFFSKPFVVRKNPHLANPICYLLALILFTNPEESAGNGRCQMNT